MSTSRSMLGFNASWSMAVGGMIGGGIFATLGVVVDVAGQWAWLSFLIGGLIALATGHSYACLTVHFGKADGAYRFLYDTGHRNAARYTAWTLVAGYTLTISVYAFTFGAYLAHAFDGPNWLPHVCAAAAIILLAAVNLVGVGKASALEIVTVWGKLVILLGLAAFGIADWDVSALSVGDRSPNIMGTLVGAATVFMAYEGFQLLTYDYDDMLDRENLIRRVIPVAILTATSVYILVALGTPMLAGADVIIEKKEVALAEAGRAALGLFGFIAVTIAAVFSTASAINATLFATARLARDVADDGKMPVVFAKTWHENTPYAGILLISSVALVLALFGGLTQLVQGASFIFLGAFAIVNGIALKRKISHPAIGWLGMLGAIAAAALLLLHLLKIV